MLGQTRFALAFAVLEETARPFFDNHDVSSFMLRIASETDPRSPAGPQFVAYADDGGPIRAAQEAGDLPTSASTAGDDDIPIVVVEAASFELGHRGPDTPMRPGSSLGVPNDSGSLGARVVVPGRDHVLASGHVMGPAGSEVFQPGGDPGDPQAPTPRKVGTVVANALDTKGFDTALVKIDPEFPISKVPWDSVPSPSALNPAAGQLVGGLGPDNLKWQAIEPSLEAVGAKLPADATVPVDSKLLVVGRRVRASGRTSGAITGKIVGLGLINVRGQDRPGFHTEVEDDKGTNGDSGAVCTIDRDGRSLVYLDTGVMAQDDDNPFEYLPELSTNLGAFADEDPSDPRANDIVANDVRLPKTDARDFRALLAAELRKLNPLKVSVTANSFPLNCTPGTGGTPFKPDRLRPPDPCDVRILGPDGTPRPGVASLPARGPETGSGPPGRSALSVPTDVAESGGAFLDLGALGIDPDVLRLDPGLLDPDGLIVFLPPGRGPGNEGTDTPTGPGPNDPPEPDADEPSEDTAPLGTCCTFGFGRPRVDVVGDVAFAPEFNLSIATIDVTFALSIVQRVIQAEFTRTGDCHKGRCGAPEVIKGSVKLYRTSSLKVSISVGKLKLGKLGLVTAKKALKVPLSAPVLPDKQFVLPCQAAAG